MKKLLVVLLVFIFLMVALLVALPYMVNVNQYKDRISTLLSEKTGLDVKIKGSVRLSTIPDFGLKLEGIHVSGQPKSDAVEYVSFDADSFLLQLKLLPLLHKSLEFKSVMLTKPDVTLTLATGKKNQIAANKDKVASTDTAKDDTQAAGDKKGEVPGQSDLSSAELSTKVSLEELRIADAKINIQGGAVKDPLTARDVNIRASMVDRQMEWQFDGKVRYQGKEYPVTLASNASYDEHWYKLDKLSYQLGDIKGTGVVEADVSGHTPNIKLLLSVSRLDLNQFLPEKTAENRSHFGDMLIAKANAESAQKDEEVPFTWSNEPIDVSVLKNLTLQANVKIDELAYQQMLITNLSVDASVKHARLDAKVTANLDKASIEETLQVDVAGSTPQLKQKIVINQLNLSQLPSDSTVVKRLSGLADIVLDVTSSGETQRSLISHLQGTGQFKVADGALKGIDLEAIVGAIKEAIKGNIFQLQREITLRKDQSTLFSDVTGTLQIANGILSNQDLVLNAKRLSLTGSGQVDLPALKMDYTLVPKADLTGITQKDVNVNAGIRVVGALSSPHVTFDVKNIVNDVLSNPDNLGKLIEKFGGKKLIK